MKKQKRQRNAKKGQLRIGNDWNAISIIALSQNNPLKAVAELVENSIDAGARHVTIIRAKERGEQVLKIIDDGKGIPCTEEGIPDFKYVATHICDSVKRRLKEEGAFHLQGEFGIGLLSFWTVGAKLVMLSSGTDGKTYQMEMSKGKPGYTIMSRSRLLPITGTSLTIAPLLPGVRMMNGEKIQRYLASELRDRIRHSGVTITIIDRVSRATFEVKPREFEGQLIHQLPLVTTPLGDLYIELYLNEKNGANTISLCRSGTRVLPDITVLDLFNSEPWSSGYLQGIIDVPFLTLTPGTRDGIIHDERFACFCEAIEKITVCISGIITEHMHAEDQRMSRTILRSVQKALREALRALPPEEYDWFALREKNTTGQSVTSVQHHHNDSVHSGNMAFDDGAQMNRTPTNGQKKFFEFAGPLYTARIRPASTIVSVSGEKSLCAVGCDRKRCKVEENCSYVWRIVSGKGTLDVYDREIVLFRAPEEPGVTVITVTITQGEQCCMAEALVTIVDSLDAITVEKQDMTRKGLPGYTLESVPGEAWRSQYDEKRNIIVINKGHRDFVYASKQKGRKLRYICRLFSKELICRNFQGLPADLMLERMIELSLYTEENLR